MICSTPVSTVAASRYCSPWSGDQVTISTAMAAGGRRDHARAPADEGVITAMQKEA
jgi:hypothetical protein